jgi:hypothetical protein
MLRSPLLLLWAYMVVLVAANHHVINDPLPLPLTLRHGTIMPYGCYASFSIASSERTHIFNSVGSCTSYCKASGNTVAAMKELLCLCSALLPFTAEKAEEARCNTPCPGYPSETCGGRETYSLWSTGIVEEEEAPELDDEAKSIHSDDALWVEIGGLAGDVAKSAQNLLSNRLGSH